MDFKSIKLSLLLIFFHYFYSYFYYHYFILLLPNNFSDCREINFPHEATVSKYPNTHFYFLKNILPLESTNIFCYFCCFLSFFILSFFSGLITSFIKVSYFAGTYLEVLKIEEIYFFVG